MITSSNWSSLLSGTLNGNPIDYRTSTDTNIKAMGSPTLDLYVASWITKYPNNNIYITYSENVNNNGYNGYYTGNIENPTTYSVLKTNLDTLYYPHTDEYEHCIGYWLASPNAKSEGDMMMVHYEGGVGEFYYNGMKFGQDCSSKYYAFRPVVCLPSSLFE